MFCIHLTWRPSLNSPCCSWGATNVQFARAHVVGTCCMYMYVPGLAQAGGARKSRTLAVTRAPKWDCFFSGVDLNSGQVGDSRVCAAWHRPGELCPWRDRECEHSTPSLENQGQSPQQKTSPCPFPKSSTQAVLGVLCTSRSPDRPRTTLGLPAAETVLLSLHLGVCEKGIETRTLLGHSQRHGQPCRHVRGVISCPLN